MSLVSAAYSGPTPLIKTPIQPPMDEGNLRPMELTRGSVAVRVLPLENMPNRQNQQAWLSRMHRAAIRAISSVSENQLTSRACLRGARCFVIGMIPSGVLIGAAQGYPVDSSQHNAYFWSGIVLIPVIAFFICCVSKRS